MLTYNNFLELHACTFKQEIDPDIGSFWSLHALPYFFYDNNITAPIITTQMGAYRLNKHEYVI